MSFKQVHFRVNDEEYEFLVRYAVRTDRSLTAVMRRLIRALMRHELEHGPSTLRVPAEQEETVAAARR